VVSGQSALQVSLVLDLYQIDHPLLLHAGQAEPVGVERWAGGVDPVDEGLLVAQEGVSGASPVQRCLGLNCFPCAYACLGSMRVYANQQC
jgi:hypothetical protein